MTDRVDADLKAKYRRLLRSYRMEENADPISNRHPWHASLAIEELFSLAAQKQHERNDRRERTLEVRILTGSFPNRVYGDEAGDSLERFLDEKGIVKILIWNESIDTNSYGIAQLLKNSNVEIRISRTAKLGKTLAHFLVVGDQAYRLEQRHDPFEEEITDFTPEMFARICFNDPVGAKELVAFFDDLWEHCHPIEESKKSTFSLSQ